MSVAQFNTASSDNGARKVIRPKDEIINVSEHYFGHHDLDDYFRLDNSFISQHQKIKPKFGFNGLGELVYYRTYSRFKEDGSKERFVDTIQRVVEGCYELQRRHCRRLYLPWDYDKAQESAQEMFTRIWDFKFLPPGRGLWMMGTKFMWSRGGASLNNCAFCSTDLQSESDPAEPYCFMMDMTMLGVGVGFDTKGANQIRIYKPNSDRTILHVINDSREGWVNSLRALLWSYTIKPEDGIIEFDYSKIRPAGSIIKGFGGKASGPRILMELHQLTRMYLNKKIGETLSSVNITELMNFIGKCVVAGNVRRSAQIAFSDSDDEEYIRMKNPTHNMNIVERQLYLDRLQKLFDNNVFIYTMCDFNGVDIDQDKLRDAIEMQNEVNSHRWASNNSIFGKVGMDYTDIGHQISLNGEPGVIWLDNMRDYGRMIDGKRPGIDARVAGCNPCFSGNMRLLTENGYYRIDDLWLASGSHEYNGLDGDILLKYGSQNVVNRHGVVKATNIYRTGTNVDLYKVRLADGSHIEATDQHEFIVVRPVKVKKKNKYIEQRVKLHELNVGDKIPLNNTQAFGSFDDRAYAELAGWCIGGGSLLPKTDGQVRAVCTCYEEDTNDVLPYLSGLLHQLYMAHNKSSNQNPVYAGWKREQEYFDHDEMPVGSNVLGRLLRADNVKSGMKHCVPNSIWNGTRETVAAFLRGFASADGYIHISDNGTIGVRISQSNRDLLLSCKLLLSQFGISSSVHLRREEGKQLHNDGKGGKKLYNRKKAYELIISGIKQVKEYLNNIGFIQNSKSVEARKWLLNHSGSNNSDTGRWTTVKEISYHGKGDTYCLTEPATNRVVIEGCEVGQCVEQSLESHELCCLVETFPANSEGPDDYLRTLKFAYLYAKTVTLLPTHNPRTNSVMLRNRRIGLSQSGIAQAFAKFGRRNVLQEFCDAGYKEVRRWDDIYSEWLCIPRSVKVTSVKPSGSVSLLAGATPGIHYPEASTYWRRVRLSKDDILVKIFTEAGYHVEPDMKDPYTMIVKFAVTDERVRPVHDVSIWEQVATAVDYQTYWADNQVSCTIKFKKEEGNDIAKTLSVFEDRLKGISFLPLEDHGYHQPPYEACTVQEVLDYNSKLKPVDYSEYLYESVGSKYCDGDKCSATN